MKVTEDKFGMRDKEEVKTRVYLEWLIKEVANV